MSLISPPPPHGQDTRGGHHISAAGTPVRKRHNARRKSAGPPPLVGASALHGVSGTSPEATWAQPLGPGRAVLTRGVSRRSGSVAYIRADASPTEVLARSWWHRKRCTSNALPNSLHNVAGVTWFTFGAVNPRSPANLRGLSSTV